MKLFATIALVLLLIGCSNTNDSNGTSNSVDGVWYGRPQTDTLIFANGSVKSSFRLNTPFTQSTVEADSVKTWIPADYKYIVSVYSQSHYPWVYCVSPKYDTVQRIMHYGVANKDVEAIYYTRN